MGEAERSADRTWAMDQIISVIEAVEVRYDQPKSLGRRQALRLVDDTLATFRRFAAEARFTPVLGELRTAYVSCQSMKRDWGGRPPKAEEILPPEFRQDDMPPELFSYQLEFAFGSS